MANRNSVISRTVSAFCLLTAVSLPQTAAADEPGPPSSIRFQLKFDKAKVAPQPLVDADKGPYLVTEVEVNGHPVPALLDTGAEVTLVDSSVAPQLGLKPAETFETGAEGGKIHVQQTKIGSLGLGAFTRTGGWVGVMDLGPLRKLASQRFAMVLGADMLAQVAVFADRDSGTITFLRSGTRPAGSFTTVPLGISQPGNHFVIPLRVNAQGIDVRIDTGADSELRLVASKWPALIPAGARTSDLAQQGAGGLYVNPIADVDSATIGNLPIGETVADEVPDGGPTRFQGVIGMGVFSRFNLLLDAHAGTLSLTPTRNPYTGDQKTMVGIQGHTTDHGLDVIHVMAHSPAEQAGLKDGDRICTLDGEKISASWKGTPKGKWMLGPAGKTVTLGRCGGGTVQVTLRPFY